MLKRVLSSAVSETKRLLVTDPAFVKCSKSYDELIKQCHPNSQFVSLQVYKHLFNDICDNKVVDLSWMQDEEYYAFGECGQEKDYRSLGNITSDSGLWCMVDQETITQSNFNIDWQQFVMSTLMAGNSVHCLDEYPMFLWLCSSFNGDGCCSISGIMSESDGVCRGLLLRSAVDCNK